MLRRISFLLVVVLSAAIFAVGQTNPPSITLDELLAKNLKAHGGADKLSAVKSVRMKGALEYAPGAELAMTIDIQRPDKVHYDFTLQGMTQMQGFDGNVGWGNDPFSGKRDAEPLGEDDLKDIQEQAFFGFGLSAYKDKGFKLEYIGTEPVEGSDAYKVKVSLTNGDEIYYYLDTDYFLEIREEVKRKVRGAEREIDTSIGNYKEVAGLQFPFYFETGTKGNPNTQKISIEKIDINPAGMDELRFKMPEKKTAAPPAQKPEKKAAANE
jgi:hypothetical protein